MTPASADVPGSGPVTAAPQAPTAGRAPASLVALMRRLEENGRLDGMGRRLESIAAAVVRSSRAGDGLRGTWLGHALHPLLTDFPLGAWMSASFLDLFGGSGARAPARRLVGFGLLASVPTVASGLAEQSVAPGGAKRVGVVHAAVNTTATALYGWSWFARRRGSHPLAVGLGVGGGVVATLGGYFGGHLSLVRKLGTADRGFGEPPAR